MSLPIAPVAKNSTASTPLASSKKVQNVSQPTDVGNTPRLSQQQRILKQRFDQFMGNVEKAEKASATNALPLQHIGSTAIRTR